MFLKLFLKRLAMKDQPLWQAHRIRRFPPLKKSGHYDVVVIGGGITGVTAAYLLKQAGKKVCLLERDRLGYVDTGLTTAHLTYVTDLRISKLVRLFGEDAASLVLEAGATAIDAIESIVGEVEADCEFRRVPGYLHAALAGEKDERRELEKEAELTRKLGFPVRYTAAVPFLKRPGIQFPDQAKFHPRKYLASLAEAIDGEGCHLHEQCEVKEIKDDPRRVVVNGHEVETDYVVIATHVPLMGVTGIVNATLFQTKIFPYSSYVIGATIPRGLVAEACFWDTSDPYYYLRIERRAGKPDYVIFGGEDHKTGQAADTNECFEKLTARLLEIIPQARPDRRWSGQVVETNDGLPYIGETAQRQFAATGFSGNGMTFGTLAGLMARDAVLGRSNPWQDLFSASRKKIRGGALRYLRENLDYPYYYLKDRLTQAEGSATRQVKRGEGRVLFIDGERVACARDDDGKLTKRSAYCTHMGCLVRWNRAERTWDCPCHGSRFQPDGSVLGGPAESDLEKVESDKASNPK
jgi:glycine/D-amino acid oxidase-like deaminating enzyme/nitrite reductase/ring-hydroxylating ferredoxin subunit